MFSLAKAWLNIVYVSNAWFKCSWQSCRPCFMLCLQSIGSEKENKDNQHVFFPFHSPFCLYLMKYWEHTYMSTEYKWGRLVWGGLWTAGQFSNMHKNLHKTYQKWHKSKQNTNQMGWHMPVFQQAEIYTNIPEVTEKERRQKQTQITKEIIHPPNMGKNNDWSPWTIQLQPDSLEYRQSWWEERREERKWWKWRRTTKRSEHSSEQHKHQDSWHHRWVWHESSKAGQCSYLLMGC